MILVWEDEQLGRNATQTSRIEGSHALVCIDAIVFLAMDAEDRSVPLVYKLVRAVLVCLLGVDSPVFVPVSIIVLPAGEPNLLSVSIHAFEVESSIVSKESLEALVVMTGQIIYRETSEAGAYATQGVFVYIRQVGCSIVDGRQIVVHALACPVA